MEYCYGVRDNLLSPTIKWTGWSMLQISQLIADQKISQKVD